MYRRILVPLEHTDTDRTILAHIRGLARLCGSSLVLIHVADGWAARNVANEVRHQSLVPVLLVRKVTARPEAHSDASSRSARTR